MYLILPSPLLGNHAFLVVGTSTFTLRGKEKKVELASWANWRVWKNKHICSIYLINRWRCWDLNLYGMMSMSSKWCCSSWWACTKSKGCYNGDLHGWFNAAHANEEWSRLEHEDMRVFPSSQAWLWTRFLQAILQAESSTRFLSLFLFFPPSRVERRYALIQKTLSDFYCVCKVRRFSHHAELQGEDTESCYVTQA